MSSDRPNKTPEVSNARKEVAAQLVANVRNEIKRAAINPDAGPMAAAGERSRAVIDRFRKEGDLEAVEAIEESWDLAVHQRAMVKVEQIRKEIAEEAMDAVSEARKKGGGRLVRSETVTVRLDPRLLYFAGLAARKQRRSVSSYIEWAVENSFLTAILGETPDGTPATVEASARNLWEADESERFIRLAITYPELLTYEEQRKWIFLRDTPLLYPAKSRDWKGKLQWSMQTLEDHVFRVVRKYWAEFEAVLDSDEEAQQAFMAKLIAAYDVGKLFPTIYSANRPAPAPQNFDLDDEIPF